MTENPIPSRRFHEGFAAAEDGTRLYYRFWKSQAPSPLFLIVHGFGEHSRRYDEFLNSLEGLPLSFAAFDLRGHGLSEGEKVYVERFEDFLSDLAALLAHLKAEHRLDDAPLILFGHSLGGLIASYFTAVRPGKVRALLLSSPCILPQLWVPGAEQLVLLLSGLFPHAVLNNPVKPAFLTHDEREISIYKRDALIQRRITFRLAGEMVRAGRIVLGLADKIHSPLYVLTAGREVIVRKSASKKLYEGASSAEKRWFEFDGFYHEILKEKGREKVHEAVKGIFQRCLPAGLS